MNQFVLCIKSQTVLTNTCPLIRAQLITEITVTKVATNGVGTHVVAATIVGGALIDIWLKEQYKT